MATVKTGKFATLNAAIDYRSVISVNAYLFGVTAMLMHSQAKVGREEHRVLQRHVLRSINVHRFRIEFSSTDRLIRGVHTPLRIKHSEQVGTLGSESIVCGKSCLIGRDDCVLGRGRSSRCRDDGEIGGTICVRGNGESGCDVCE